VGYQDYDCSVDLSTQFFFSLILLYYKHYDSHDTVHDGSWVAWRQVMAKDRIEDGYGQ
jgi:hypothetical protein